MKPADELRYYEWEAPDPEWTADTMRALRRKVEEQNERERLRKHVILNGVLGDIIAENPGGSE